MTTHNSTHKDHNNKAHRERPLGHLAAVVSHRTRSALRSALADAGISRRDLRLLAVLEREPQTAEALAEHRARRMKRHGYGPEGEHRHERGNESKRRHAGGRENGRHNHVHLADRVGDLEARGLISKDASGILSVTESGAEVRRTGRETLTALKERTTAGISEGDLETTRRTLTALAENLATGAAEPTNSAV